MQSSAKAKLLTISFIIFISLVYFSYRLSLFQNLKHSLENDVETWMKEFGLEKQTIVYKETGKSSL